MKTVWNALSGKKLNISAGAGVVLAWLMQQGIIDSATIEMLSTLGLTGWTLIGAIHRLYKRARRG